MLTVKHLATAVGAGEIDTVVLAIADMQGRTLVPSAVIARATTQLGSAMCSPSTISTLMGSERGAARKGGAYRDRTSGHARPRLRR